MVLTQEEVDNYSGKAAHHIKQIWFLYGDRDIGLTEIFQYLLEYEVDNERELYRINEFLRPRGIVIPIQGCVIKNINIYSLSDVLVHCKTCATTHSAYAWLVGQFIFPFPRNFKVKDLEALPIVPPKWLQIVLNRQKRLALNAGLSEDDMLFFPGKKLHMQSLADSVNKLRYCIQKNYGYNIDIYMKQHKVFRDKPYMYGRWRTTLKEKLMVSTEYLNRRCKVEGLGIGRIKDIIEPGIFRVLVDDIAYIVPVHKMVVYQFDGVWKKND